MLVGYMRVSSGDDRQSVDLQRDALLAAGVDQRHLHHDKASGARDDRPGLKKCLDELLPGDVLVVWKLDRLGRSLPHLLAIIEDLKRRGVAFRSLTEQMDTTTPHGELLFSIFGALAQYERALTTERVKAGLAAARRRGRRGGRPFALDPERIQRIVEALEGGASKASVCRSFKVPRSTLLDTLARAGWTGPAAPAVASAPLRRRVAGPAQDKAPSPLAGQDGKASDGDARRGRENGGQRSRSTQTATVVLWLRVENNSKFVRGKSRVRERIETYHLARYGMVKLRGWEYELTIPYESDAGLDETMDDLIRGMADEADLRNCFIEHDIREKGTDRYW